MLQTFSVLHPNSYLKMCYSHAIMLLTVGILCSSGDDEFVCRKIGRCIDDYRGTSVTPNRREAERVSELENQVRQLQMLLTSSQEQDWVSLVARDCQDYYDRGGRSDGVYSISPDGDCRFDVFCNMSDGGWTVIQRRQDGSINFHKTWDDYVTGFGQIDGEYWLGLEKMHRLTRGGVQILFEIQMYDDSWKYAHYKSFTINDVSTRFKMRVDPHGYEGTFDELLSYHDNMMFSTYDRDNDEYSTNCASSLTGGWWYRGCWRLGNLNGIHGKRSRGGMSYWKTSEVFIKNSVVKIKRRREKCT